MNAKKTFYLVINPDGDAYESAFRTEREARDYISRRTRDVAQNYSRMFDFTLTLDKRELDYTTLAHILEGEGVNELWGN